MNTIKLVADPTNKRAQLFQTLVSQKPAYTLVGAIEPTPDVTADCNVFFNFSGFESNKEELLRFLCESNDETVNIVDMSFSANENVDNYQVFAAISAKFVTTNSGESQELLYENTGRLCSIVEWPLFAEDFLTPDDKTSNSVDDLSIVWHGYASEIFTIKPYLEKPYKLKPVIFGRVSEKVFNKKIMDADMIFLPKTFTKEDEETRLEKVESMVRLGKFVVAPGLDNDFVGLASDLDLDDAVKLYLESSDVSKWIKESQEILKRKYNPEISADQLVFALKEAPKDDFAISLDYFKETEGT